MDDIRYCQECGERVQKTKSAGYAFQCKKCDTDLYFFETIPPTATREKLLKLFESGTLTTGERIDSLGLASQAREIVQEKIKNLNPSAIAGIIKTIQAKEEENNIRRHG